MQIKKHEEKLVRSSFVWSLYLIYALFSFTLSMIGPMAPRLQEEFGMSYALTGLHQSAYALGMVIMGIFGSAILNRMGTGLSAWLGLAVMLLGVLAMVLANGPLFTLLSVLITSLAGTLTTVSVQISISERPGAIRRKMVIESNVATAIASMTVPLVLLLGDKLGQGWRIVFPFMLLASVFTALPGVPAYKKHKASMALHGQKAGIMEARPAISLVLSLLIIFFVVTVEWSFRFWSMSYLLEIPGSTPFLASLGVIILYMAKVGGRFAASLAGSRITEKQIMNFSILMVLLGFPLFWLRMGWIGNFAGLALCGMGSSNFFPMGLNKFLGRVTGNKKWASLVQAVQGAGIGLSPFLLGRLADLSSLKTALLYVPVGTLIVLGLCVLDESLEKRHVSPG
ncbi:hypothetical protein MASR2M29_05080 [Spirochaetota bacterium]